jgi:choline dehydrogenase-like flavoprotein
VVPLAMSFDFIVVGAGASGCAFAGRLAALLPRARIALVESDTERDAPAIRFPNVADPSRWPCNLGDPKVDYGYETAPQRLLNGRTLQYSRGRGLGGSTLINAMLYSRGFKEDWDAMPEGWRSADVEPDFNEIERQLNLTTLRAGELGLAVGRAAARDGVPARGVGAWEEAGATSEYRATVDPETGKRTDVYRALGANAPNVSVVRGTVEGVILSRGGRAESGGGGSGGGGGGRGGRAEASNTRRRRGNAPAAAGASEGSHCGSSGASGDCGDYHTALGVRLRCADGSLRRLRVRPPSPSPPPSATHAGGKGGAGAGGAAAADAADDADDAGGEVILCGGAVDTPKLLQLSGFGPRELLARRGIPLRANLPVGLHLKDHPLLPMAFWGRRTPAREVSKEGARGGGGADAAAGGAAYLSPNSIQGWVNDCRSRSRSRSRSRGRNGGNSRGAGGDGDGNGDGRGGGSGDGGGGSALHIDVVDGRSARHIMPFGIGAPWRGRRGAGPRCGAFWAWLGALLLPILMAWPLARRQFDKVRRWMGVEDGGWMGVEDGG